MTVFSTTLGDLVTLAGRRSIRGALLPSFVFCALSAMILVVAPGGGNRSLRSWQVAPWEYKVLVVAGFVLVVLCVAAALNSAQTALIRLAEGYWGAAANRTLGRLGRSHHQQLVRRSDDAYTHDRYPPISRPHELMPTRLGNILKAAELYPRLRYGIDTVLVWPRLHPLLPEAFLQTLGAARTDLTGFLGSALLAAVLTLGGAGYLWVFNGPTPLLLMCLWGGGLVAWLCYRGALLKAMTYGQHLRVAFDLYRGHLLEALGHPVADSEEERAHWERLCLFWHRGIPLQPITMPDRPASPPAAPAVPDPPFGLAPSLSQLTVALLTIMGIAGALVGTG
ncbi:MULTISPECIES: hypothetical protein [Streptomyces]|uniref:hypothetical protein n=1 Tax=Streptomyces TaxID=1883 RepID=UPI00341F6735